MDEETQNQTGTSNGSEANTDTPGNIQEPVTTETGADDAETKSADPTELEADKTEAADPVNFDTPAEPDYAAQDAAEEKAEAAERPTDQEVMDQRRAELDEQNREHLARTNGETLESD